LAALAMERAAQPYQFLPGIFHDLVPSGGEPAKRFWA
jgi:hypothetical protein